MNFDQRAEPIDALRPAREQDPPSWSPSDSFACDI
jgi:hypothetical protein